MGRPTSAQWHGSWPGTTLANFVLGIVLAAMAVAYLVASTPRSGRSAEVIDGPEGISVSCWDDIPHGACLARAWRALDHHRIAHPELVPAVIEISDADGDAVCHATSATELTCLAA